MEKMDFMSPIAPNLVFENEKHIAYLFALYLIVI